jgi:glycerol uptake facilitator-like aquaporin
MLDGRRRLLAEFTGSAFLLATVIGSGVMGATLAGGNTAIALLANTLATGAILTVLITMLGPISGAHFNPAVTAVLAAKGSLSITEAGYYLLAQVTGAILGVFLAHAMFDLSILQMSQKSRSGWAQGLSEWVATFGLLSTVLLTLRAKPEALATSVGLYITAAYWFTASTSFANPAVTLARAFSDTFAGIRLADVPLFMAAQLTGAFCALWFVGLIVGDRLRSDAARSAAE